MALLREQLDGVVTKIATAYREVGADGGASPVLVAVVRVAVASLAGTVYAIGWVGIVFYLVPGLWWRAFDRGSPHASAWRRCTGANRPCTFTT